MSENRIMKKPEHLRPGDKVAIVSLSSGSLGEEKYIHKFRIAKERLDRDFGLEVVAMPNALKGKEYLDRHPEARAEDFLTAFADRSVKGVINSIGGDDTIRLLPYIDFDLLARNPKIFTGFSDTTTNHFMLWHAGVISYYGANVMCNFSEYGKINDYTDRMIRATLFDPTPTLEIPSAPYWCDDEEIVPWDEKNVNVMRSYHPETVGYEILQGSGAVEGQLLGGCLDVFIELFGTPLWIPRDEWRGKIAFFETSEEDMPPEHLAWILRNFAAQGLFDVLSGILVGKPARRDKYGPYKAVWRRVVGMEAGHPELPILYNVNFGHAVPIGVIPYGVRARLDADAKTLTLLEPATA